MKYTEITSFKKHIESSFPGNLSNLYLLIVSENFERLRIIDNITCYFPRSDFLSMLRFTADKISVKEVISNLESPSLLGSVPIIVLDEIDLYGRKDLLELVRYLKNNRLSSFFVLASKDKKSILTLLSEVDRRGLVLDLSAEKPWEKKRRLSQFIVERCAQSKKSITLDAREIVLSFMGVDMSAIDKEIEKVITFVGEKDLIEKKDILSICSNINSANLWQIAEMIVWGDDPFSINLENKYSVDSVFFHSLIIALRYNLQEGIKLASALESDMDLSQLFPSLRPKIFQSRAEVAARLRSSFFRDMLECLFDIDLLSKEGMSSFLILIDYFRIKLAYLKKSL